MTGRQQTFTAAELYADPNPLAEHYSRFRVRDRILLSGHSHQAWPDRGFEGHLRAWEHAERWVDDKWERAFAQADTVREGYRRLLDDPDGCYTLSASTHDLLVKLLSALPLSERDQLVATDAEFHSLRRQLLRLEEEGIEVIRVAAHPPESVAERLAAAVSDRTAAVFTSTVFYSSGQIAGDLTAAAAAARAHGAILVLDAYHQLNVVPFSLAERELEDAYVVGGGYKYCQLGEGNAFLRYPADCPLRPVATGWFAEFATMTEDKSKPEVLYNPCHDRFAGATYDPTSTYRGAEVFAFFDEMGLEPTLLREVSQHQIGLLCDLIDALDLDPAQLTRDRSVPLDRLGGFLALHSPHAGQICRRLKERDVYTDFRADVLRLGPAPYLSDRQLRDAIQLLDGVASELA